MDLRTSLFVFVVIVIAINNAIMFYVVQHRGSERIQSTGLIILFFSVIEIVAIGIKIYISVKR